MRVHLPNKPVETRHPASAQSLYFQDFAGENADRLLASAAKSVAWRRPGTPVRLNLPLKSLFWNVLRISSLFPRFCEPRQESQASKPHEINILAISTEKIRKEHSAKIAGTTDAAPILEKRDEVASQGRWIASAPFVFGSCCIFPRRSSAMTVGDCKFYQSKSPRSSCISSPSGHFSIRRLLTSRCFQPMKAL